MSSGRIVRHKTVAANLPPPCRRDANYSRASTSQNSKVEIGRFFPEFDVKLLLLDTDFEVGSQSELVFAYEDVPEGLKGWTSWSWMWS